jgi:hypothetical protein
MVTRGRRFSGRIFRGRRRDPGRAPDKFKEFVGAFDVEATGEILSDWSIETKIVREIREADEVEPYGPRT